MTDGAPTSLSAVREHPARISLRRRQDAGEPQARCLRSVRLTVADARVLHRLYRSGFYIERF
jgi:hypothetical protein